MTGFSMRDAIWSGFRLVRREWRAVLVWGGLSLLASLPGYAVLIWHWDAIADQAITPADMASLEADAFGWNLLSFALSAAVILLVWAAVMRAMFYPEDRRFFYLRLSARELWMALTSIVQGVLQLLVLAVFATIIVMLLPEDPDIWRLPLPVLLTAAVGIVTLAWIGLRLSMACPMAFEQRRIPLLEAFRLTGGHTLRILGVQAAVLGLISALGVGSIVVVMIGAMVLFLGGAALVGDRLEANLMPVVLVLGFICTGLGCLYSAAIYAITLAPPADIYRQLTAAPEEAA